MFRRTFLGSSILLSSAYCLTVGTHQRESWSASRLIDHKKRDRHIKYPPLQASGRHIRLLRVEPARGDGVIRCTTQRYDLDDEPDYDALSYMWGERKESREINIELNECVLAVRENLWSFLNVLQHEKDLPLLWCDMVCIDQGTTEERNRQVGIMGRIYSQASGVRAWITDPRLGNRPYTVQYSRSRYWGRMWIVQELVLARHITFYGDPDSRVADNEIHVRQSEVFKAVREEFPPSINAILELRRNGEKRFPFMELLRKFAVPGCDNVCDKIYALRSISLESADRHLNVDYGAEPAQLLFDTLTYLDPEPGQLLYQGSTIAQALRVSAEDLTSYTSFSQTDTDQRTGGRDAVRDSKRGEDTDTNSGGQSEASFCIRLEPMYNATVDGAKCLATWLDDKTLVLQAEAANPNKHDASSFSLDVEASKVKLVFLDRHQATGVQPDADEKHRAIDLTLNKQELAAFLFPGSATTLHIDCNAVAEVYLEAPKIDKGEIPQMLLDGRNSGVVKVTDSSKLRQMSSESRKRSESKL